MPNYYFKPPKQLVTEWPEVFEDLYMNTLPLEYLEYIRLEFTNGRVWQISISDQLKVMKSSEITSVLVETLSDSAIIKLDFKMNIDQLKKDIRHCSDRVF